ncbi:16S rRNA (adenine(1518)-N(6)/adenine(1519)-N(6))-dimethyltransferase RsmA [Catellicoccus marimammalium]|uniref:Ribosomal RNA small subunit methyltransferase A n=1 Tax=Catellicoccus marimammalium M35/04/3 TaxID=1234409 RepID=K8ZAB5_9ENTE|nr:16S rRNA (adenine(1518)-N(6)/adenine(1519)-N(6))-dimethyltransferase RsmA [Catellicoccus marimammalium]EKU27885.1 Dimethyladenosine transferase [Catellicoccus marimammalium M35/04/3]
MIEKDIASPSRTKEILQRHGFSFKKSLGQNFLTEPNILRHIAATAELNKESQIIEVGPGIGALTEHLARSGGEVLAFEIDGRLLPILEETLAPYDNVTVVNEDVLKVNLREIASQVFDLEKPIQVVANLPYYITTPIMMHFLESDLPVEKMVVMMQKEVAERIQAKPKSKAYGSLSIAVQYYMEASIAFIVPKTAFVPQPNVDSAILKLERRQQPLVEVKDEDFFFKVVKAAFQLRRKTLWNNLLHTFGKDEATKAWLEQSLSLAEIDPKRRGETLSIEEFASLANHMLECKQN